jgi:hypothetical protein
MPKLRWLGATKIPLPKENTGVLATSIVPPTGRSRPAMERNVVVLPQPLGPSRVNSLPSGTLNEMSRAARTTFLPSAYSVLSALTDSIRNSPRYAAGQAAIVYFSSMGLPGILARKSPCDGVTCR